MAIMLISQTNVDKEIDKVKVNGKVFDDVTKQTEIMNETLQSVFTRESHSVEKQFITHC